MGRAATQGQATCKNLLVHYSDLTWTRQVRREQEKPIKVA
jgi:hypothetical protein